MDEIPNERDAIRIGLEIVQDYKPDRGDDASDFDRGMALLQDWLKDSKKRRQRTRKGGG